MFSVVEHVSQWEGPSMWARIKKNGNWSVWSSYYTPQIDFWKIRRPCVLINSERVRPITVPLAFFFLRAEEERPGKERMFTLS